MAAATQTAAVDSPNNVPLRSALRKAAWRILPLLGICYLVAYMDRANISFAAESMNHDLHFTSTIYGFGAGLFFLSYASCEVPSNHLLLRFGARRWLARIMLTWGLLAAAMMFVRTPAHFYGARLLLGCAEAGYFPGALYFLSQWFPVRQRARAISFFYISLPLSTVLMGGVAGSLLKLDGRLGLRGWQWMFLVEALPAILLAFVVWFALPHSIKQAKWLTDAERSALTLELATNPSPHGHAAGAFGRVVRDPRILLLGLMYFLSLGVMYAEIFSLPIVLRQLTGWPAGNVGYLIAAVGLSGAASMLAVGWLSSHTGYRRRYVVSGYIVIAVAAATLGLHFSGWTAVITSLTMVLTFFAIQGPAVSAMTTAAPGEASAVAIAFINMFAIVGGFVGPYWMGWMHDKTGGYATGLGWLCVPSLMAAVVAAKVVQDAREASHPLAANTPIDDISPDIRALEGA